MFDLKYANFTPTLSPRCETFIDHVYQDLVRLHHITIGVDSKAVVASQNEAMEVDGAPNSVTDETKRLERLAKTGFLILNIFYYDNNFSIKCELIFPKNFIVKHSLCKTFFCGKTNTAVNNAQLFCVFFFLRK